MEALIHWLMNSSEDFQIILYFSVLLALIYIEKRFRFREFEIKRRKLTNYILTVISILSLFVVPISFMTISDFSSTNKYGLLNIFVLDYVTVGLLTLLLRGFISFITHFLAHKIPLFWRIHRVHHLDTEMDISTTVRFHPFEIVANLIIGIPFVIIFGLPVWGLLLYELLDISITLFSHSNIKIPEKIDKVLRYIIVTPNLHRIHHSSFQKETDSNYGAVFPIWDIIFGTFKTKTKLKQENMKLGLEDVRDIRVNKVLWLLTSPFRDI